MFETSVVRERAVARSRYPLLVASVAVHSIVVVGVLAVSVNAVRLPTHPPKENAEIFNPVPPPPPAAPPAQRAQPAIAHPQPAAAPHAVIANAAPQLAPQQIPNSIPTVAPSTPAADSGPYDPNATSTTTGVPNGVGDPNGVGTGPATADQVAVPDTIFHPGGEVRPAIVLQRVDPAYPHAAIAIRLGGTVVLKCIVDKSGQVRDPEVVTASHPAFAEPALAALRQWRFTPGVFRGQPVDTYFELTIRFQPR